MVTQKPSDRWNFGFDWRPPFEKPVRCSLLGSSFIRRNLRDNQLSGIIPPYFYVAHGFPEEKFILSGCSSFFAARSSSEATSLLVLYQKKFL